MNDRVNKYTHVDCPGHLDYLKNTDILVVGGRSISPRVSSTLRSMSLKVAVVMIDDLMSPQTIGEDTMILERSLESEFKPQINMKPKNQPFYRQLSGGNKKTNNKYR